MSEVDFVWCENQLYFDKKSKVLTICLLRNHIGIGLSRGLTTHRLVSISRVCTVETGLKWA